MLLRVSAQAWTLAPRKRPPRPPEGHSPMPSPSPLPTTDPKGRSWEQGPTCPDLQRGEPACTHDHSSPQSPSPRSSPQPLLVLTLWTPAGSPPVRTGLGGLFLLFQLPRLPALSLNPSDTLGRPHQAQKLWRGLTGWGMQDW